MFEERVYIFCSKKWKAMEIFELGSTQKLYFSGDEYGSSVIYKTKIKTKDTN